MDYASYLFWKHRMLVVLQELYPAKQCTVGWSTNPVANKGGKPYFWVDIPATVAASGYSFRVFESDDIIGDFLNAIRRHYYGRTRHSAR